MNRRVATVPLLSLSLLVAIMSSGCLTPWNTRFPTLLPGSLEYERRESEVQDPFPDSNLGPGTSMRPPSFNQQRSDVTRARERGAAAALRQQFGAPGTPRPPELGVVYPETVRP